jgi:hypothetical protein
LVECGANVHTKVWFNPIPLILGTGLFAACTAWLALGPDTSGPVGRVLSSNGGALTIVAVAIGLVATLVFAFHAIRMTLGKPALVASDDAIHLYVLPVVKLRWSEIADVRIEEGKLLIVTRSGKSRRINLALLGECDAAVAEMQAALAKQRGSEQLAEK